MRACHVTSCRSRATTFALYLFRDYHLMLDEQGEQIFDATDDLAERVRKIGGT
jgi:hypothetical protein